MSTHCGYIVQITQLKKHENAGRLQIATIYGTDVVVGIDVQLGDIGVYFPSDLQLGVEFCEANNLCRKKDENGNNIGGFLDPEKRNVKPTKLRGVRSDGLYCPISSLSSFVDISTLSIGDTIAVLNGVEICRKFIPESNNKSISGSGVSKNKHTKNNVEYPVFSLHVETEQLAYNIRDFKPGDTCYITLKMHGTNAASMHTIESKKKKRTLFDKILKRPAKQEDSWKTVSSSRRVILNDYSGGYYGDNSFRKKWNDFFDGKLHKGEEVFYEIVGYVSNNKPIMADANNNKLNDKEFVKQYGSTTRFSYGCEDGESDIYVFRMTMTNEDGYTVEYPWELVKQRCEQMGVKCVPEFDKFIYTTEEDLMNRVNCFVDGVDPIGKTHIREGIVVRIDNRPSFKAYKAKNFNFKVLEGIIKEYATEPDIEEAQEV